MCSSVFLRPKADSRNSSETPDLEPNPPEAALPSKGCRSDLSRISVLAPGSPYSTPRHELQRTVLGPIASRESVSPSVRGWGCCAPWPMSSRVVVVWRANGNHLRIVRPACEHSRYWIRYLRFATGQEKRGGTATRQWTRHSGFRKKGAEFAAETGERGEATPNLNARITELLEEASGSWQSWW